MSIFKSILFWQRATPVSPSPVVSRCARYGVRSGIFNCLMRRTTWQPSACSVFEESARVEAAFRKYCEALRLMPTPHYFVCVRLSNIARMPSCDGPQGFIQKNRQRSGRAGSFSNRRQFFRRVHRLGLPPEHYSLLCLPRSSAAA